MVVRRSDARRRRLVVEPATLPGGVCVEPNSKQQSNPGTPPSSPPPRGRGCPADARAYAFGGERRNQLKTTDLIPKRALSYLSVVLVILGCLALINFFATQSPEWGKQIGADGLAALAISGAGSIANWFMSFLLILAALSCLQIFAMRQHRCNDYRGTYRLWIWMAGLLLFASMGCVVDLGLLGENLTVALLNQSAAERVWLAVTIKLTILTLIAARLLFEVRESRGSIALVSFVWLAFSSAVVTKIPSVESSLASFHPVMITGNCLLFGTAGLLMAHLTYGRYVYLRANGLILLKVREQEAVDAPASADKKTKRTKKATLTEQPKQAAKRPRRKKKAPAPEVVVQDDEDKSKEASKPATVTRKSTAKSTTTKAATPSRKKAKRKGQPEKSPSEVLKELAAASRAKEKSKAQAVDEPSESSPHDGSVEIIKMSKSQRRKQRKLEKQRRRAA